VYKSALAHINYSSIYSKPAFDTELCQKGITIYELNFTYLYNFILKTLLNNSQACWEFFLEQSYEKIPAN
jgi:hypothetical protein